MSLLIKHREHSVNIVAGLQFLPEIPLVRYVAGMTPMAQDRWIDRVWPLVSLLVFTCAAADKPKSFMTHTHKHKQRHSV